MPTTLLISARILCYPCFCIPRYTFLCQIEVKLPIINTMQHNKSHWFLSHTIHEIWISNMLMNKLTKVMEISQIQVSMSNQVQVGEILFCVTQLKLHTLDNLSSTIFCCLRVCEWVSEASVSPDQTSTFANIYRHWHVLNFRFGQF